MDRRTDPITELDSRYSDSSATATPWSVGRAALETAEIYWLSTVRPDGRPHVTPLIAVWIDDVICFCTGEHERKAMNLVRNQNCVITTGCNHYGEGLDLVVEGEAVRVTDPDLLQRIATAYKAKYDWDFAVRNGEFVGGEENVAHVYRVLPTTAFGFGKGTFSQTRWLF